MPLAVEPVLHKGQWHGALMFSLICVWINGWITNRGAGDLRRHRAHYDVIIMKYEMDNVSQNLIKLKPVCGAFPNLFYD